MIKNGYYVLYKGKEYSINRGSTEKGTYFRLYSDETIDMEKGFIQYRYPEYTFINGKKYVSKLAGTLADYYIKDISSSEVGEVYSINTAAEYKGVIVGVEKENDTQYLLYKSHDKYGSLGFDLVAKGEYEKWINKDEVSNVHEVKRPIPDFFED